MGRREHKSIICMVLVGLWIGLSCLWISGCSDNPEAEAAKKARNQTTKAVQKSVIEKDYNAAQQAVVAALEDNRPKGLTEDAALLASGNFALIKGQQMQTGLSPQSLKLFKSTNDLEATLRNSEKLLVENERVEMLLAAEDQEVVELQGLLDGQNSEDGLHKQLEQVDAERQQLLTQLASMQAEQEKVQAVLDQYQSQADALMHQAELEKGAARLDLENQAFSILKDRKDHYMEAQSLENQIAILDDAATLVNVRFDGLTQNIQEVQQRIEAINTSPARSALRLQMREIEQLLSDNKQTLTLISGRISTEFAQYRKLSEEVCAVYEEAMGEFKKIGSPNAKFAATARLADSAHQVATVCSMSIRTHKDLTARLQGLLDTADMAFVSAVQSKLPMQSGVSDSVKKKAFDHFDQAIEVYEQALKITANLSRNIGPSEKNKIQDAKCSLLKSELLASHGKMQLADLLDEPDLANTSETAVLDVIERGRELGVCFTQSEILRVVENKGLNYQPLLPLNMEVFVEGKKQELSRWKQLPITEQEAAVDSGIQQIDELIEQYGEEVSGQLEPLKRDMLAAKERGFEATTSGGGFGDPNSVSGGNPFGEPNSMF